MCTKPILPAVFVGVLGLLLNSAAGLTAQSIIEDFSGLTPKVYNTSAGNKATDALPHLPGWEVGGQYFTIQDVGTDRVMNPNSSYSGLDVGIKLAVS